MRVKLLLVAGVVSILAVTKLAGQAGVGPVAPKPTVGSYEKTLDALLKKDSPDRLWDHSDAAKLERFLQVVEGVNENIYALSVGPVPPKPKPTPFGPKPRPKPTKKELEDAIKGLHATLHQANATKPNMTLPKKDDADLKVVIDSLTKGAAQ